MCGLISYSLSNGGTVSASPLTHCALPACAPSAPQTPTHRSLQSLQMRLPLLQNTDDKINYIEHRDNKTPKLITSQLFYCVLQLSMLSTYINVPIRCLVTKVTLQIKQTNIIKQVFFWVSEKNWVSEKASCWIFTSTALTVIKLLCFLSII